ncbi:MAG: 3-deoxy-manno-octulosonate cytidylyltransferase (CMP-KDO synthetase) [Myxococcota bacterium]|jgi:3-deoxy-manno-octulosonate cytidylyltransferase (CMP-KDO synthetase)
MSKILIIIPARLASTRLPNKPLADILGIPMISRVFLQAQKANLGEIIVACDSSEIADEIKKVGGTAIITDPELPSGTDRIFAALKSLPNHQDFEIIVNLQGDLPAIDPEVIISAAKAAIKSDADIATVASVIGDKTEINNPNVVKIAIAALNDDKLGQALYFSRAPIPHGKGDYFHHIGIYAYKRAALEKFVSLKPSNLEKRESLEQLRALENQMKIAVQIVDSHPLSVDTAEDLQKIKDLISKE